MGERSRRQLPATVDEDDLWQAVLTRDAGRDGSFVYAVRSTGIFCRPSCASRRPRRDRVLFFAVPEAARAAGYRPCRRCRPQKAAGNPNIDLVRQTCQRISATLASPEERVTLRSLGEALGISPYHLQRTFKRITGITPRQYADACRLGRLKARLKERRTVTMSLFEAGYGSSSRLYEQAAGQLGMTPATYRRGGLNARIGYTVVSCPLGRLLMGATDRGISAVYLGDDDGVLETALTKEYPAAQIRRDDLRLQRWVEEIVNHLSGHHPHLDLPLDVQATAFQRRVWQELQAIPYGSTRSYREVAQALGQPSASRAVARACATNPVSIVVPCHRVVRGDGSLGGYRWGLNRKRLVKARERGSEVFGQRGAGAKRQAASLSRWLRPEEDLPRVSWKITAHRHRLTVGGFKVLHGVLPSERSLDPSFGTYPSAVVMDLAPVQLEPSNGFLSRQSNSDVDTTRRVPVNGVSKAAKTPVTKMPSKVPAPPMEATGAPNPSILSRLSRSAPISAPMLPAI